MGAIETLDERGNAGPGLGSGYDAAWSPDGRRLAVMQADGSIEIRRSDGTPIRMFEALRGYVFGGFAWSPDATRIVFVRDEPPNAVDFAVLDVRSGTVRRLAERRPGDLHPTWSPDGRWIAFLRESVCDQCRDYELRRIRPDGTGMRLLASGGSPAESLGWSPGGTRLVLSASGGYFNHIYTVSASAGRIASVTFAPPKHDLTPAWSPNGSRIVFHRAGHGEGMSARSIWLIDPDGTDAVQLASGVVCP